MISSRFLVVGALSGLVLAGCTAAIPTAEVSPTSTPMNTPISAVSPSPLASGMMVKTDYTIDMKPYAFSIKAISAKPGQKIMVKLTNSEGLHDMVIDELDVKSKQLKAGEEEIVTIMIPEDAAGKTYEYYCSVGNHKAMGMVGKITVK